jgi:Na+-translocating ferredoxin:NAD+ oxidoreductase subunit G
VPVRRVVRETSPVILLTVVVAICVSLLTYVGSITLPRIEAQEAQKIQSMLSEMFSDMSRYTFDDDIYTIYSGEISIGYAFVAAGKGYGGVINLLVGLDDEKTMKGITVISHGETPGLGAKITESFFTEQFAGIAVEDVALRRDGGHIDAITGATISSRAVAEAVRVAAIEKLSLLEGGG